MSNSGEPVATFGEKHTRGLQTPVTSEDYRRIRQESEAICARLETEDHVVQPAPFVSPPKWHLAHTSWFFDRFMLQADSEHDFNPVPGANLLFNSYYKSQGTHWLQESRGHLSRPPLQEILNWRRQVDEQIVDRLEAGNCSEREYYILTIGLEHEKQHQELLLMDIKYILAEHPWLPSYDDISRPLQKPAEKSSQWLAFTGGQAEFGSNGSEFSYDNERPRHTQWLSDFQLTNQLMNNGEFLAFIEDNGYQRPELWLSDGWDWLQRESVSHPLYWRQQEDEWHEYHMGGLFALDNTLPVSHISFFEADAFARWRQARLPTEFELEHFLQQSASIERSTVNGWKPGRALCPLPDLGDHFGNGLLWQWTSSAYGPYPGFVPETGAIGEYNGKFMSNQYVLKGGCVATPRNHYRNSYRNFYRTNDRWAFTGLRLARSCNT